MAVDAMGSSRSISGKLLGVFIIVLILSMVVVSAAAQSAVVSSPPKAGFDLLANGFRPLSLMERSSDESHFTVDYLDSDHVLVTFDHNGLIKRRPECPSTHRDRIVKAFVYQISTASVERQTEWYMHDRMPYLWALGGGKLLLRRGNTLYRIDRNLEEKVILNSDADLIWVNVTPDGSQIMVETRTDHAAPDAPVARGKTPFEVRFLDASTVAAIRTMQFHAQATLEASAAGYPDVVGNLTSRLWLVRYGPEERGRTYVARVRTQCLPEVMLPTANTLLIGRCSRGKTGYSLSAFTVTGHRLWREKSEDGRYGPRVVRSENGERFALSTLRRPPGWVVPTQPAANEPAQGEGTAEEKEAPWVQIVDVYETAGGSHVLSVEATPYIIGGHNSAVATDGSSVAVLRGTSLEIHTLPPITSEDKAKALALKADTPGLYLPSADSDENLDLQAALTDPSDAAVVKRNAPSQPLPTFPQMPGGGAPSGGPSAPVGNSGPLDPTAPALTIRKSTLAVIVDVVATDPKDHPISGMKKDDFSVKEDGSEQRVRSFEEHRGGEKKVVAVVPPPVSANTFTNLAVTSEIDSLTVILYDTLNSGLDAQAGAQKQLVNYLKTKPKDQHVAVYQLGTSLRLISGFTDNEDALIAAVAGKKSKLRASPMIDPSSAYSGLMEKLQADYRNNPLPAKADEIDNIRHTQMQEQNYMNDRRIGLTLDAFSQLGRYLSGIPGRKNLIWLSGSFPLNVFPNMALANSNNDTRNYQTSVKKALDLLAAAHVAVYPVGIAGVRTQSSFMATEVGNPSAMTDVGSQTGHNAVAPSGPGGTLQADTRNNRPGMMNNQSLDFQQNADKVEAERATMETVAADTGGKAFTSTNGLKEAIQTAVEQGSDYYTLSYSPANTNFDGRFRKIKVDLAGQGHRLAYRNGYFADDPDAPSRHAEDLSHDLGLAAMQLGSPESRQIAFLARVTPVDKPRQATSADQSSNKLQRYAIDWAVSAGDLRFVPNPDGKRHGVFNLMITAFDSDAKLVKKFGSTATSDLSPKNYNEVLTAGYRIHTEVDVPVNAMAMRLGVQDTISSKLGTVEIKFPIPPPPDMPVRKARALPEIEPE